MNSWDIIYLIICSIVGTITGLIVWHVEQYVKRKKYRKERMWDILNGK